MNDFSLNGKTALLTGASGGIGEVIAQKLLEHGANVILSGRKRDRLLVLCDEFREIYGSEHRRPLVDFVVADLSSKQGVDHLANTSLNKSPIDILVHCAGLVHPGPALEKSEQEWDDTLDVNLKATFFLTKAIIPQMMERGGGKVVMIGSTGGIRGLRDRAAYASSKGGMIMLTKQLAVEWGARNIRVNMVAPTVVMTPMAEKGWADPAKRAAMLAKIPAGRFPHPVDVANAVVYLSSPAADILNGVVLPVDGGLMA